MSSLIDKLTDDEKRQLEQYLAILDPWQPHPSNKPQNMAFESDAQEILFGGSAGGSKTDTMLGLARVKHTRSLIIRRNFPELERSVIARALQFMGGSYNSAKHMITINKEKLVEFGHMEHVGTPQLPGDEAQYSSAPYDFIGFDQVEEFPEYPYMFMFSRLRTAKPGQKTQMFATANWVGENLDWIIKRWRDWLGEGATAKPGEIRWYYRFKGEDDERTAPDGNKIWDEGAKDWVYPTSRTFIRAGLADNPYLGEDYKAKLQQLPEPMCSALLYGDLHATRTDDAYQVLPRAWVKAAMSRWMPRSGFEKPPVVGVDVARGGEDNTVLAPRWDNWYDELKIYPGAETRDGQSVANVMAVLDAKAHFNIDVINIGASVFDIATKNGWSATPVNFGAGSKGKDQSGSMSFLNKRAEYYWKFREALDPKNGINVCLPPDPILEADLCSVKWEPVSGKIQIQEKKKIKEKIGRSPDRGDAVVLAWGGDMHVPTDEELHDYGAGKIKAEDITDDMIYYRADTLGVTFEEAKEILRKELA